MRQSFYYRGGKLFRKCIHVFSSVKIYTFFPNGNVRSLRRFNKKTRDAVILWFYQNEQIKKIQFYRNGIKDGKTVEYSEDGKKKLQYYYRKNLLHGRYLSFYNNGTIHNRLYFRHGQLHGNYFSYYEDGQIMNRYKFAHNSLTGRSTSFFHNGITQKLLIFNPKNGRGEISFFLPNETLYEKTTFYQKGHHVHYETKDGDMNFIERGQKYFHIVFEKDFLKSNVPFRMKEHRHGIVQNTKNIIYYLQGEPLLFKQTEKLQCCVCLEPTTFTTNCKHPLCVSCTKGWKSQTETFSCPLCRRSSIPV